MFLYLDGTIKIKQEKALIIKVSLRRSFIFLKTYNVLVSSGFYTTYKLLKRNC